MTTTVTAGSAPAAGSIWSRFLAGLDRDGDGALKAEELAAVTSPEKARKALTAHDANGDGRLGGDELPEAAFSPQVLDGLLDAQGFRDATPEARATDDAVAVSGLFARADLDGDSALSRDEWDAERAFGMAGFLDTGALPGQMIFARVGADDNDLAPDDFVVGRALKLEPVAMDQLPEDLKARLEEMKALAAQFEPQVKPPSPAEERAELRNKLDAIPMSAAFMTRLIALLGEAGRTEAGA